MKTWDLIKNNHFVRVADCHVNQVFKKGLVNVRINGRDLETFEVLVMDSAKWACFLIRKAKGFWNSGGEAPISRN